MIVVKKNPKFTSKDVEFVNFEFSRMVYSTLVSLLPGSLAELVAQMSDGFIGTRSFSPYSSRTGTRLSSLKYKCALGLRCSFVVYIKALSSNSARLLKNYNLQIDMSNLKLKL